MFSTPSSSLMSCSSSASSVLPGWIAGGESLLHGDKALCCPRYRVRSHPRMMMSVLWPRRRGRSGRPPFGASITCILPGSATAESHAAAHQRQTKYRAYLFFATTPDIPRTVRAAMSSRRSPPHHSNPHTSENRRRASDAGRSSRRCRLWQSSSCGYCSSGRRI